MHDKCINKEQKALLKRKEKSMMCDMDQMKCSEATVFLRQQGAQGRGLPGWGARAMQSNRPVPLIAFPECR